MNGEIVSNSYLGAAADTDPEAAAEQRRLFARMEPHERLQVALDMSMAVRRMAASRLQNRDPGLSADEVRERLIDLCYDGVSER